MERKLLEVTPTGMNRRLVMPYDYGLSSLEFSPTGDRQLNGTWRKTFVIATVLSLYLNFFV